MASRVGLLLMVDLPELGGLHVVLQVRGTFNPEKLGPESYPGGCQITCAGKVERGESPQDALVREMREELGIAFTEIGHRATWLMSDVDRYLPIARCPAAVLQKMRLHAGTGGLRLVRKDTPIESLKTFRKVDGVCDRNIVAMFPDEAEAVRKAFKFFSHSPA